MPNITHNLIETDTAAVIQSCIDENGEIDYSLLIPVPDDLGSDFVTWAYDNWGAKWGEVTSLDEEHTSLWFDSPWCGPVPVFEELCRRFPDAKIDFYSSTGDGGG